MTVRYLGIWMTQVNKEVNSVAARYYQSGNTKASQLLARCSKQHLVTVGGLVIKRSLSKRATRATVLIAEQILPGEQFPAQMA
jgi:hypothetical protein